MEKAEHLRLPRKLSTLGGVSSATQWGFLLVPIALLVGLLWLRRKPARTQGLYGLRGAGGDCGCGCNGSGNCL